MTSFQWSVLMTVALTSLADVTRARCPWAEEGLFLWSDPAAWDSGQVPGFEEQVVVNKRVLLDVQPPSLATLTVEVGGALVWGNKDGITLNTTYIHVKGEFHVGSDDCRFRKQATINLYGRSDSPYQVGGFGKKFLGVHSGGILEMHGLDKVSWTRLAHTIPAALQLDCSLLYDHTTTGFGAEGKRGVHVLVWNPDGSVFDFNIFDANNYNELAAFIAGAPDNSIVGASVKKGIQGATDDLFLPLEALGSTLIRSVQDLQKYAFVAKKGDTTSAVEVLGEDSYASLNEGARGLAFRVASLADNSVDFQVMDLEVGQPKITLQDNVTSWTVGSEILVTSTDFDWRQAEVKRMVDCPDCLHNQIRLDSPFKYMHYGEVTHNVDERAEVALLTRNVKVQGQLEEQCYASNPHEQWLCDTFGRDLFGAHTKAVYGATYHIQGIELYHMGQQHNQAAYPLHFHMMNDASGQYVRDNSIHDSLARCVTIHGTHRAQIENNVCFLHLGHGYFFEDGVEQNNTLRGNLGAGTMHGSLLLSDRHGDWCGDLALYCDEIGTYWLTHPNNFVDNNVAAGSDGSGFFYVFADAPIGVSKNVPWILEQVQNGSVQYFPLLSFDGNVAHSNYKSGIFFDSRISTGEIDSGVFVPENGILPRSPFYSPRDPPDATGVHVWTDMSRSTFYKNERENAWVKGGNIRMIQSSFADANRGFTGGTIGQNSGTMVKDSVFIGETDNVGMPQEYVDRALIGNPSTTFNRSYGRNPYESWTAISIYQGPIFVENCFFDRYGHWWWQDSWQDMFGFRPVRPGGAISFQRTNIYPTKPWTYVEGAKWGYCDDVNDMNWVFKGNLSTYNWDDKDGNKALTFHDMDGSVTGTAHTQVVIDRPFFTGPECVARDNWHMTVCPYKYVQMEVSGRDGVLDRPFKDKWPLSIRRDDVPDDVFQVQGQQKNTFLMRTHKSYTLSFNQTLSTVPYYFDIEAYGIERGDVVRVGLCLPKDTTTFDIRSLNPSITAGNPYDPATSLQDLDDDVTGRKFFWDASVGLLYFKLLTNETRQNITEECANDLCVRYRITRVDGGAGPADCSAVATPPIADNTVVPAPPQRKVCTGADSREGLGMVPDNVLVADPFTIQTCPALDPITGRLAIERRGCFRDKSAASDVPFFTMDLASGMTQQFCQDRCYGRGYVFSALTLGKRCSCSDTFGLYGALGDDKCSFECTGDASSTCGGQTKVEVFTTGRAVKTPAQRCGPQNQGEVVDGQCMYASHEIVKVSEAQRVCARMGGHLISINTAQKQLAVEDYLRDRIRAEKVWIGLNRARDFAGVWEQRDGTPLGSFSNWKGSHGSDPLKPFVFISGADRYQWVQTKDTSWAAPLCDLPVQAVAQEPCGEGGQGRRLGSSGTCYMAVHNTVPRELSEYACRTAKGRLASFTNRASEEELASALYVLGMDQDYWTENNNRVMQFNNSIYYPAKVTKTDPAGALCVLETLDAANRCPSGWVLNGDSCYLSIGTDVRSYSEGASLCQRGNSASHVVRVETEAENVFLSTLIPAGSTTSEQVLLGMFYSPRFDQFVWDNGVVPSFSQWAPGNGRDNLLAGPCAVLDSPSSGSWQNVDCDAMALTNLVCEMPAFVETAY